MTLFLSSSANDDDNPLGVPSSPSSPSITRTHQAKNRFKNSSNQRNDSSRQNHLNSSLYGMPTTDKSEKEEEKSSLTI